MKIRLLLLILSCFYSSTLLSQGIQLTNWNTITSLRTVTSSDVDAQGRIWAGTTGGLVVYDISDSTTKVFRNIRALQTLYCSAVYCDRATGSTFVGAIDGALDIVDSTFQFTSIPDIRNASQYQLRGIMDFTSRGDTLLMATQFGVVSFDKRKRVFIETIDRIGTLEEKTPVNSITIFHDSLWLATDNGIAVSPLNVPTLRNPAVWKIIDSTHGMPARKANHIRSDGDHIYITSKDALLRYDTDTFSIVRATGEPINGLTFIDKHYYLSTQSQIVTNTDPVANQWADVLTGHTVRMVDGRRLVIAHITNRTMSFILDGKKTDVELNSPLTNQFAQIAIDTDGGMWVATDIEPPNTGRGFAYYKDGQWTNVYDGNTPQLPTVTMYRVRAMNDGSVIFGMWGKGALRARAVEGKISFESYDQDNSTLTGLSGFPSYVLAGESGTDRSGNIYVVNEQSGSNCMSRLSTDGTWKSYVNRSDSRNNQFRTMCVDGSGGVWMGSPVDAGMLLYNVKGTPDDVSDDVSLMVRTSNSQLPDNTITALRTDKSGAVWIGTSRGVAVISSPSSATNTTVPFIRRITVLSSPVVNDIYVDALNYKWIATTAGVFVLNEDGTEVLATITSTTTPLISNDVSTIAINDNDGTVYFGTRGGCTSVNTQSIKPVSEYKLEARPQPFKPAQDDAVIIDGLVVDSDIRIITPNGFLVYATQSRGRQIVWDGRDTNGDVVPPGVYLVHTVSTSTKESAIGKIVVSR